MIVQELIVGQAPTSVSLSPSEELFEVLRAHHQWHCPSGLETLWLVHPCGWACATLRRWGRHQLHTSDATRRALLAFLCRAQPCAALSKAGHADPWNIVSHSDTQKGEIL
eukprot:4836699-Prymnesium_polylepis.5